MEKESDANYIINLIKNSFEFGCSVFFKILFLLLAFIFYSRFSFIKDSFQTWLIIQVVLTVLEILLYFTLVFIHLKIYRKFIRTLESILDFIGIFALLIIYPFDLSKLTFITLDTFISLDGIARIFLGFILVATLIGIIVNSVQLVLMAINLSSDDNKGKED